MVSYPIGKSYGIANKEWSNKILTMTNIAGETNTI